MKRHALIVSGGFLAAMLLASAGARADKVIVNKLPYEPVTVVAVAEGAITFTLSGDRRLSKSLSEVGQIVLDGEPAFNQAEELLAAGKIAEAKAAYGGAARAATGWKRNLIQYRLLAVAEAAMDTVTAVGLWLDLADAEKGSRGVLALRPKNFADKGSPANQAAIARLEDKAKGLQEGEYLKAVQQALVDLYSREEQFEKAQAMAQKLGGGKLVQPTTGKVEPPKVGNGDGDNGGGAERPLPPVSAKPQLSLAALAYKTGKHDEVIGALAPIVKRLPPDEMPTGMYLLGAAQLAKAEGLTDAAQARPLYLSAGLNLTRVVVFFKSSPEAARSLYLAGRVNEKIGNATAAKAAYENVVNMYGKNEAAQEAEKALEAMKAAPTSAPAAP